jgi:hypothetical protein
MQALVTVREQAKTSTQEDELSPFFTGTELDLPSNGRTKSAEIGLDENKSGKSIEAFSVEAGTGIKGLLKELRKNKNRVEIR